MKKQENKVKSIKEIAKIVAGRKEKGEKVALITGCFDVLHYGYLTLFDFVKDNADLLIIGLDNDVTIRASKGPTRPIFGQEVRAKMLSGLVKVDYVFVIQEEVVFDSSEADNVYEKIVKIISPGMIVTNTKADRYWKKKALRAKKLGVEFLKHRVMPPSSSSKIAALLGKEL